MLSNLRTEVMAAEDGPEWPFRTAGINASCPTRTGAGPTQEGVCC
jgi:hypothetical protein